MKTTKTIEKPRRGTTHRPNNDYKVKQEKYEKYEKREELPNVPPAVNTVINDSFIEMLLSQSLASDNHHVPINNYHCASLSSTVVTSLRNRTMMSSYAPVYYPSMMEKLN